MICSDASSTGFPTAPSRSRSPPCSKPADVTHYRAAGADVVLIGEALVTGDPVATLESFLAAGDLEGSGSR